MVQKPPTRAAHVAMSPKRKRSAESTGTTPPSPSRLKTANLPAPPQPSPPSSPPGAEEEEDDQLARDGSPRTVVARRFRALALDPISELDRDLAPPPPPGSGHTAPDIKPARLTPAPPRAAPIPSTPRLEPAPPSAGLWWKDDEITGHAVSDPTDDDGTGINGVGFLPTPAIASARAERRRRQLVDWKNREAREARQRRSDVRRRREAGGPERGGGDGEGDGGGDGDGAVEGGRRKVRFLEG